MPTKTRHVVRAGLGPGASGAGVEQLARRLRTLGFLPLSTAAATDDFDTGVQDALTAYQAFHRLAQTGVVDAATADHMSLPRCGNPDVTPFSALDPTAFVASGGRWPSPHLRYGFKNWSQELSQGEVRQAVHQAFSMWAGYSGLTFREVDVNSGPEIVISFESGDHGDGEAFDGGGANGWNILAHAFFPASDTLPTDPIRGDTHFDEAETWTISVPPGTGSIDLTTVAVHEFGHALGLKHSPVTGAVMEATYAGPRRVLQGDDIQGIASLYPPPAIEYASWIHGHSGAVEFPNLLASQRALGWGLQAVGKPSTFNWFHFAVPTPVIVKDDRLAVGPCMLRMRTAGTSAVVRHVHIWDGDTRLVAHDHVDLSGDIPFVKFGVANAPEVRWGVGISVGVEFANDADPAKRIIDFFSAGCDFRS